MKTWISVGGLVIAALIIIGLGGARILDDIFYKGKCTPFAQKNVPDENDGNWKLTSYSEGEANETYRYVHKQKNGLKLGVYLYFDEIAFKAWACRPNEEEGDVPDHMVAVWKDGQWYSTYAYAKAPKIYELKNDGRLSAVKIVLLDKDGKLVVERTITRPK